VAVIASPRGKQTGRRTRGSERGAVIFVVLLVLAVLTAIGVFAAHAAGLNQRVSGYSRQATQTEFVAEYGATAVVNELSSRTGQSLMDQLKSGADTCSALAGLPDAGAGYPCYQRNAAEVARQLQNQGLTNMYFDPDGGSLGASNASVVGDFRVEMTDPGPAPGKVAATELGDRATNFKNRQITITAYGQVRPASTSDPDGGVCSTPEEQAAAQMAATRAARVYVTVRNVPE